LITRELGAEGFGEFSSVQLTMTTIATVFGLGLNLASTRYVARYANLDPIKTQGIVGFVLLLTIIAGLVASTICLCLSPLIAANLLGSANLTSLVYVASPLIALTSLSLAQVGLLFGFEAFGATGRSYVAQGVATITTVPAGALIAGAYGAMIGQVLALVVACLVNHRLLVSEMRRRGLQPRFILGEKNFSLVFVYGAPALVADAAVNITLWVGTLMLIGSPGGLAEAGVFRAANQWYMAAMMLPSVASSVFLPILSERLGQGDREGSLYIFSRSTIAILVSGVPLALVGAALATSIMSVSGADFLSAGPVLVLMIWTALIQATQSPAASVIQASGRMWLGALMNIAWGIVFLSAFCAMSKSAESLALSRLLAFAAHSLWSVVFVTYFFRTGFGTAHLRRDIHE